MRDCYMVGIDEVGRGPIAGPLLVCAALLPPDYDERKLLGVNDSKQLSREEREEWYAFALHERTHAGVRWGFGWVSPKSIDNRGMAWALKNAVATALKRIDPDVSQTKVFLDGSLRAPDYYTQETIIKGDSLVPIISLASVIAKVTRDRKMAAYGRLYPGFGFEKHMGYGTKAHYTALREQGMTNLHRKSFLKGI